MGNVAPGKLRPSVTSLLSIVRNNVALFSVQYVKYVT